MGVGQKSLQIGVGPRDTWAIVRSTFVECIQACQHPKGIPAPNPAARLKL
jgi:hypothetical protein